MIGMTTSVMRRSIDLAAPTISSASSPVGGGQHRIALAGQRPLGDGADHRLVLDQQDGAGAPRSPPPSATGSGCANARRSSWWTGQVDDEAGPLAHLAVGEDEPPDCLTMP
jgi:hypothetical protein